MYFVKTKEKGLFKPSNKKDETKRSSQILNKFKNKQNQQKQGIEKYA